MQMNFSEQTPKYLVYNGLILMLLGIRLLFTPTVEFRTMIFDFSGYNVPTGIIFIIVGLMFLYGYSRGRQEKKKM